MGLPSVIKTKIYSNLFKIECIIYRDVYNFDLFSKWNFQNIYDDDAIDDHFGSYAIMFSHFSFVVCDLRLFNECCSIYMNNEYMYITVMNYLFYRLFIVHAYRSMWQENKFTFVLHVHHFQLSQCIEAKPKVRVNTKLQWRANEPQKTQKKSHR